MNSPRFCFFAFYFALSPLFAADPPFEIRADDRVLLIGDTLIEREGTYGYLETRMHEQFPDRKFTVRNLGFAGDTPLGWSRASFDPPAKGWERLKEQLALVRPTVAFIGYGMAASLQEMTDRSGDSSLNPDPTRYGAEPMTAARFKRELSQLMDAIAKSSPSTLDPRPSTSSVRFVLLSPIRHEDLRARRPGLPDPAEHNKLLEQYSKAIEELAKERAARFVNLNEIRPPADPGIVYLTSNGLHLTEIGYAYLSARFAEQLGFGPLNSESPVRQKFPSLLDYGAWLEPFRAAVIKKNELFFHRWRPANSTYLFGFRKHEQGQNAAEIPQFDPLIAQAEAEIDRLKRGGSPSKVATTAPSSAIANQGLQGATPLPQFSVADGYQIELWAENPLLEKPTQMNWDVQGRLWVCSSSLYPQIAPGEPAHDKILILEDTDRDGKADKSTVFADGLLIPTGVEPDIVTASKVEGRTDESKVEGRRSKAQDAAQPKSSTAPATQATSKPSTLDLRPSTEERPSTYRFACYVGQSTELLHFADSDGDGKANEKRIVLSGFGTEDTHHIIHTLHWGPDGRLYFNQSVYIHSHLETPHGMVRLNSGGILAYDPRTERVEVFARGWWNSWGHQMDKWGQSFATDGAGSTGISWVIPGAVYPAYEGSRRVAPGISPGSYPKFCGLEILYSPHFPADWQGNAIACDFRAHRIVRFSIQDLSVTGGQPVTDDAKSAEGRREPENTGRIPGSPPPGGSAGYTAKEMPDFIRTSDLAFRPIDGKLGPNGALYIADWSNPVINHGEVDFRDPRRDKHRGRIWRVTKKDAPLVKWEPLEGKKNEELLERLLSANLWEKEQARKVLVGRAPAEISNAVEKWMQTRRTRTEQMSEVRFEGARLLGALRRPSVSAPQGLSETNAPFRAASARENAAVGLLTKLAADSNARVRLEAIRALARNPTARSAELVLDTCIPPEKGNANVGQTSSLPASRATDRAASKDNPPPSPRQTGSLPHISTEGPTIADPFLEYAAWLSINELARPWTEAIANGTWKTEGREKQLAWGLSAIEPALASATVSKLFADNKIPLDGSGPWIELLGKAGGPKELRKLFTIAETNNFSIENKTRTLNALIEAARLGNIRPASVPASERPHPDKVRAQIARNPQSKDVDLDLQQLLNWHSTEGGGGPSDNEPRNIQLRLAITRLMGYWPPGIDGYLEYRAQEDEAPGISAAACESLARLGYKALLAETATEGTAEGRQHAVARLAALDPGMALAALQQRLTTYPITDEKEGLPFWRNLLATKDFPDKLANSLPKEFPKPAATIALRAARELGRKGEKLVAALAPIAGVSESATKSTQDFKWMVDVTKRDGDPARGELIYRRANLGCVTCHAIGGAGGKVGPELTSLGASAPLDYIIESTLNPAAKVKEGFNAVTYTLKDGAIVSGVQARETAQEIFLRDITGRDQSVVKANIASKQNVGSIMPAGIVDQLPNREQLDLFAFLGELGKAGVYDASKGLVARFWTLYPGADGERVLRGDLKSENSANAFTLVDGRLLKEQLVEALQLVTNAGDVIYAVAQFQTATAGKTRLNLTGAAKAWLDGKPLVIEPNLAPEVPAGPHHLAVRLDVKLLPEVLRAETPDGRFLGN